MCTCQHQRYDYICDFACSDCGHAMAIDTAGHLHCIKREETGPNDQGRFQLVYVTLRLLNISHAFKKINDGT